MIKLIVVGKTKENYFNDASDEYVKRLSRYVNLKVIEIKDSDIEEESEKIMKSIKEKDTVIGLDINGKQYDSVELSKFINNKLASNTNITFVIGGSYGLGEDVLKRCDYKISFSKLTFPHKLFKIMFLEQLYRAFKIENNESYHK